jgi:hypothetical protein
MREINLYATRLNGGDDAPGVRFTVPDHASTHFVQRLFLIAVENLDGDTPSEYRRGMVNLIAELVVLPDEFITDCMERVDKAIVELQKPVPRPDAIRCEVVDREYVTSTPRDHFILTFGRPGRVEITRYGGDLVAWVYEGTAIDTEQEPLGSYDHGLDKKRNTWEA